MRLFVLVFALLCSVAQAQEYPTKPVRMLVPFAPGGAVDTTARVLAQAMQARVNWQFVVENRPGGNGFIATTAVAKSAPDGYTLLMAHTGEFAVNPALFENVPYDLERDFVAITMVSDAPMLYLATGNQVRLTDSKLTYAEIDQYFPGPATLAASHSTFEQVIVRGSPTADCAAAIFDGDMRDSIVIAQNPNGNAICSQSFQGVNGSSYTNVTAIAHGGAAIEAYASGPAAGVSLIVCNGDQPFAVLVVLVMTGLNILGSQVVARAQTVVVVVVIGLIVLTAF